MKVIRGAALVSTVLLLIPTPAVAAGDVSEIIAQTIAAVGDSSRLGEIKAVSIETSIAGGYRQVPTTYTVAADGRMKIVVGDGALVEQVTVVDGERVEAKSVRTEVALSELEKTELRCLARLFSGLFSLRNLATGLQDRGVKRYGPEKHRVLERPFGSATLGLFIGESDHLIKRLVLESSDVETGKIMSVYDFGPPQESEGLRIPSHWYKTFIGPRDRLNDQHGINKITIDPPLAEDFFATLELSFGEVTAKQGVLQANVVEKMITPRGNVIITTNCTPEHIGLTGFVNRDKIQVEIGEQSLAAVFLTSDSDFQADDAAPGNVFLLELDDSGLFSLVLFGESYKPIHDASTQLQAISVRRSSAETGGKDVKDQSS